MSMRYLTWVRADSQVAEDSAQALHGLDSIHETLVPLNPLESPQTHHVKSVVFHQ